MLLRGLVAFVVALVPALTAHAQGQAAQLSALSRLPVKEVTVFKDGHAYVLHEGKVAVDSDGEIRMDYLPTPVLGTFWAYSADARTPIKKVTANRRRVQVERTALTLPEMVAANIGAEVSVREKSGRQHDGKIEGIPERSASELEQYDPPNAGPRLPERSNVVMLSTHAGYVTVPMEQIDEITFKQSPKKHVIQEEFRNLLALYMPGIAKGEQANVGLMYVQKGIRWIPGYQVTLDGKGSARVRMQATLINELIDLKDATVHLVIGVPTFAFEKTPDPIALQQTFAQLSPYFDKSARSGQVLSNAIMGQAARMREVPDEGAGGAAPDIPEIEGQGKSEDLFVFKVGNVTLKKGARMVLPVAEFTLPYKDVYTLNLPYAPPPEARSSSGQEPDAELARLLASPKVEHKIRLTNTSAYPLTTAPALVMSDGRVLAQGMMTYTAVKAVSDLPLTTAVDIKVKRDETEVKRIPNAVQVGILDFSRTDMAGKLLVTNYGEKDAPLEVRRYVVGHVDRAEANGTAESLDPYSEDAAGTTDPWMRWYAWPGWWRQVNAVGRFTWNVTVPAGKSVELSYTWHYFWR
jgi:hypothetical protein